MLQSWGLVVHQLWKVIDWKTKLVGAAVNVQNKYLDFLSYKAPDLKQLLLFQSWSHFTVSLKYTGAATWLLFSLILCSQQNQHRSSKEQGWKLIKLRNGMNRECLNCFQWSGHWGKNIRISSGICFTVRKTAGKEEGLPQREKICSCMKKWRLNTQKKIPGALGIDGSKMHEMPSENLWWWFKMIPWEIISNKLVCQIFIPSSGPFYDPSTNAVRHFFMQTNSLYSQTCNQVHVGRAWWKFMSFL